MSSEDKWNLFELAIYLIGVLVAGRIAFCKLPDDDRLERALQSVFIGVFWPFIAAFAILVSPLLGIGWLISRPTGAERRARQIAEREARIAEVRRLEQQYDLPGLEPRAPDPMCRNMFRGRNDNKRYVCELRIHDTPFHRQGNKMWIDDASYRKE